MKTENWTTVKETLQEALNLPISKRSEFFRKSGINADIRREVESLLTHERDAKDFMSVTASGFTGDFFYGNGRSESSFIGQQIGVYEIVGELDCGGMGAGGGSERKRTLSRPPRRQIFGFTNRFG